MNIASFKRIPVSYRHANKTKCALPTTTMLTYRDIVFVNLALLDLIVLLLFIVMMLNAILEVCVRTLSVAKFVIAIQVTLESSVKQLLPQFHVKNVMTVVYQIRVRTWEIVVMIMAIMHAYVSVDILARTARSI